MTDDLTARADAYDGELLIGWTPEAVQARLIEAADVFSKTPARIGPKRFGTAWPQIVITAQDLVDEETQQRLMRFPHLVGDWQARIDPKTIRHLSREKQDEWERAPQAPSASAYSRAEEALLWPARYLGGRPLLADAITLWAFCIATGASLRASLRKRRETADAKARLLPGSRRQEIMPGKNFDGRLLNERRKEASAVICAALVGARVMVREAAEAVAGDLDE